MMTKFLVVLLVALLWAFGGTGWAATYYVDLAGSNTSPYDTPAKAATYVNTVLNYIATIANDKDTVYIAAGTYDDDQDRIEIDHANHANTTIIGAGRTQTVIQPNSVHAIPVTSAVAGVTISDLTIKPATGYNGFYGNAAATVTISNVDFIGVPTHSHHLAWSNQTTVMFNWCRFWHSRDRLDPARFPLMLDGKSSGTVNYCLFLNYPGQNSHMVYIKDTATGTHTFRNCTFAGSRHRAVQVSGGTVNMYKCYAAGSMDTSSVYVLDRTGGTYNVYNTAVIGQPRTAWTYTINASSKRACNEDSPISDGSLPATAGWLTLHVDDTLNYNYAKSLADTLAPYGWGITWFVNVSNMTPEALDVVRQIAHMPYSEVGLHGYSHTNLSYKHALTFTYGGADANPTVTFTAVVDSGDGVIHLETDGNDDLDIDTTSASYDTLGEIVALSGTSNWAIAKSTTVGQTANQISLSIKAIALATKAQTAAPCDIDFDRTGYNRGFFKAEITDAIEELADLVNANGTVTAGQTGEAYVPLTMAAPYNAWDRDARQAAIDAGLKAARGIKTSLMQAYNGNDYVMWSGNVDLFLVPSWTNFDDDGNEANCRKEARALAMGAAQGALISILTHNSTQISLDELDWFVDEWAKMPSGFKVMSLYDVYQNVASTHMDNGDGTYSKAFTDDEVRASSSLWVLGWKSKSEKSYD